MPPYILSNLIIEPTTENAVVTHVIINSYQLMVSTPDLKILRNLLSWF